MDMVTDRHIAHPDNSLAALVHNGLGLRRRRAALLPGSGARITRVQAASPQPAELQPSDPPALGPQAASTQLARPLSVGALPAATATATAKNAPRTNPLSTHPAYIVVDDRLRVLEHNDVAAQLFTLPGSALRLVAGVLKAETDEQQHDLVSAVVSASYNKPQHARHAHACRPRKLTAGICYQLFPMHRPLTAAQPARTHLLILTAPQGVPGLHEVATRHRLTPTEVRLLEALCTDSRPKDYAFMLKLSVHTVRTQLRSILSKLGVHSQIEAVRMVLQAAINRA